MTEKEPVDMTGRDEPGRQESGWARESREPVLSEVLLGEEALDAHVPIDDEDADLLAPTRPRTDRWTLVLAGALIAALGFGAGAIVQRNTGAEPTATAGSPFARGAGGAGRGAVGGFVPPGGAATNRGEASSGSGASSGNSSGGASPAVIGTVVRVEGTTLVVRNLAGGEVTVTVPDGTKVTTATTVELSALKPGTPVTVTGTKDGGDVTASAVTARPKEEKK